MTTPAPEAAHPGTGQRGRTGEPARLRVALGAIGAAILGAAPHVLHHAGPLAGAALFAGVGGSLVFGALGLVLTIPMLRKLRRRTGSWLAPAGALGLFSVLFLMSSFVVGPALTGDGETSATPTEQTPAPSDHEEHHP